MEVVVEPLGLLVSYMAGQPQRVSIVVYFHLHHLLASSTSLVGDTTEQLIGGEEEVGSKKGREG